MASAKDSEDDRQHSEEFGKYVYQYASSTFYARNRERTFVLLNLSTWKKLNKYEHYILSSMFW